jgi:DNA-binding ferritin-like protein (Dps family)
MRYRGKKMKGIFFNIHKIIREKAEYKAYLELLHSLPSEYQFVSKEIEKYMFSIMIDESVMPVLMNTVESFAIAAADGRSIFSITGADVGAFCDDLLKKFNVQTWAGKQREKLNENIHKKFGLKRA